MKTNSEARFRTRLLILLGFKRAKYTWVHKELDICVYTDYPPILLKAKDIINLYTKVISAKAARTSLHRMILLARRKSNARMIDKLLTDI